MSSTDLDPVRRMLDDGVPIPPWLVRGLVERAEKAEASAALLREALADLLRVVRRVAYTKFEETGQLSSVEIMADLALKNTLPDVVERLLGTDEGL
jgi:hypothetical protein